MYHTIKKMQRILVALVCSVYVTVCVPTYAQVAPQIKNTRPLQKTIIRESKKESAKAPAKKSTPQKTKKSPPQRIPERQAFFPASSSAAAAAAEPIARPAPQLQVPKLTASEREAATAAAVVNIVCRTVHDGVETSSIGSGVVISKDGVILTNAHVGIYSLMREDVWGGVAQPTCVARTGSPATYAFPLEAVYVPRAWVDAYASKLFTENLKGTGESDYMLLRRKKEQSPLWARTVPALDIPSTSAYTENLPFLAPATGEGAIAPKDTVLGAGYPAEFLGSELIREGLSYASSYITVGEAFTFKKDTADTYTLPGTILARAGISGGPAINEKGAVVGIMSTATREGTTSERTLRTITLNYIARDIFANHNISLNDLILATPAATSVADASRAYAHQMLSGLYK